MPVTIEERVAYLEGKVEEHSRAWEDLKDMMIHLDQRITLLDQKLDRRIDALDQRLSSRIDALDQKVDRFREELMGANAATNSRIDALDQKFSSRIDALDQRLSSRIDALDGKFSRYFLWIIGIQVTILLAIIATFLR